MGQIIREQKGETLKTNSKSLIDAETGEIFDISDSKVYKNKFTGKSVINYRDFVFMDVIQIQILNKIGAKQEEIALLIMLATQIDFESNVCLTVSQIPHDTASIAKLCQCSRQAVKRKLNRLIDLGALAYDKLDKLKKVYIVNPHIIKKGQYTRQDVIQKFKEIKHDFDLKKIKGMS